MNEKKEKNDSESLDLMSRNDIAKALGISAERVAQLERNALMKVRAAMIKKGIRRADCYDL